jgi:hypothetical protein
MIDEPIDQWRYDVMEMCAYTTYCQLVKVEKLLKDIKSTGSQHQINEKIDNYFKKEKRDDTSK